MPECRECGDDTDEIAEESEGAMRDMMGYKGKW